MATVRCNLIDLDSTAYYHVVNRCIRRAFIMGDDPVTGKNYDHRKEWLIDRIKELASIFAINICAYTILSNHYHIVIHVDRDQADSWSEYEILERWGRLYKNSLAKKASNDGDLSEAEQHAIDIQLSTWRNRLCDISWFMRTLNEPIARQANQEDQCTGKFWEGRFKSQALLDEGALLTCMAYVDLNPIRANIAKTPETSDFTSIQERILHYQEAKTSKNPDQIPNNQLMPFLPEIGKNQVREFCQEDIPLIPFTEIDYIELVDWTGRAVRTDKKGEIPDELKSILHQLEINDTEWITGVTRFEGRFRNIVGHVDKMKAVCVRLGKHWLQGMTASQTHYRTKPT